MSDSPTRHSLELALLDSALEEIRDEASPPDLRDAVMQEVSRREAASRVRIERHAPAGRSGENRWLLAAAVILVGVSVAWSVYRSGEPDRPQPERPTQSKAQDESRDKAMQDQVRTPVDSVDSALDWLRTAQREDGSWDVRSFARRDGTVSPAGNAEAVNQTIILTGLVMHAFVQGGSTLRSGRHKDALKRATVWLRKQSRDGAFGQRAGANFVHTQAIATFAMTELFHASKYKTLRKHAKSGLDVLAEYRHRDGGWKASVGARIGEPSLAIWGVLANVMGEKANLVVPKTWSKTVHNHLQTVAGRVSGGSSEFGPLGVPAGTVDPAVIAPGATAAVLWARILTDRAGAKSPGRARVWASLGRSTPVWSADGKMDHFGWFCTSRALREHGGDPWQQWSTALRATLVPRQRVRGDLAGSWDPAGCWGKSGGRVYTTAILTMALLATRGVKRRGPGPDRQLDPAPRPELEELLRLFVQCQRPGRPELRIRGERASGYRLVGHEVIWNCGPKRLRTLQELRAELRVIAEDPNRWARGRDGKMRPLPVVVRVGEGACFGDVVVSWDVSLDAGLKDLRLSVAGVQCEFVLRAVAEPKRFGLEHLPPRSRFGVRDEPPAWRPVLRVDQRGRISHGDQVLVDPEKSPRNYDRVDAVLAEIRKQAETRSLTGAAKGRQKQITAPVMIWVDRWTEWSHVDGLVGRVHRAGFRTLHFAVAEKDVEAAILRADKKK